MSKTTIRRTIIITSSIALIMAVLAPIVWMRVSIAAERSKYRRLEKYYYSDKDSFNAISSYFKGLYSEGLSSAEFSLSDADKVRMIFHDSDGKWLSSTEKDVSGEEFTSLLEGLRQKYEPKSEGSDFTSVYAYYDKEGDMLLIIPAYSEEIKKDTDELHTPYRMKYYLVYYDEEYSGTRSFLGIDKWGAPNEKPFADRWCTYSRKALLG